jgi:hypothetical protein
VNQHEFSLFLRQLHCGQTERKGVYLQYQDIAIGVYR